MIKLIAILISLLLPGFLSAQMTSDSAITNACNDKVFVRVEVPPAIKTGPRALEDSLTSYLKAKNMFNNNTNVTLKVLVTKESQLVYIVKESGELKDEKIFKEALLHFSDMWTPATQNFHIVCAYARLTIQIRKGKLKLSIS